MSSSRISARVATLEKPGQLTFELQTIDPATLEPTQILCETLVTAISPGTELAAYGGASALRPGTAYPRVVGYCNVARVLRCGSAVASVAPGDRVLTFASHRSHFVIAAADVLARVSPPVRSEDAVSAYLFHLGYNAVLTGDVRLGSRVVVLGLGVVGLGATALAALAGARVFGVSNHVGLRDAAVGAGAGACFDRGSREALFEALGPGRAHVVITTSNTWADWELALEVAGQRGTVVVMGFPGRGEGGPSSNPLASLHFYTRQLRIVAGGMSPEVRDSRGFLPFNERDNLERILDWLAAGVLRADLLISGELPAAELAAAYTRLARRDGGPLTLMLRWAR